MTIRKATSDDLDLVARMRLEFLAAHRAIAVDDLSPTFRAATRDYLEARSADGRLHSWLAEDDDVAVGVVTLLVSDGPPRPDDLRTEEGYILNMYVRASHRRRGIGQALFDACLAVGGELDLRRLYLRATDDGRPMYERAGFRTNDEWMERFT
jgi:GNAT superfamily N-acetyltransferase